MCRSDNQQKRQRKKERGQQRAYAADRDKVQRELAKRVARVGELEAEKRDVLQECANAINAGSTLEDLSMMVHTHPTLCEVLDEAFKAGLGRSAH